MFESPAPTIPDFLKEEGFIEGKDYAIDPMSDQVIFLNETTRDRFTEMFPMFKLSSALTEETDQGWRVRASYGDEVPINPELADATIEAKIRSLTQE